MYLEDQSLPSTQHFTTNSFMLLLLAIEKFLIQEHQKSLCKLDVGPMAHSDGQQSTHWNLDFFFLMTKQSVAMEIKAYLKQSVAVVTKHD